LTVTCFHSEKGRINSDTLVLIVQDYR